MRVHLCPCCERPAVRRQTPLTDEAQARGYIMMVRRGWTAKRLLDERREDLNFISPDMVPWMERMAAIELATSQQQRIAQ